MRPYREHKNMLMLLQQVQIYITKWKPWLNHHFNSTFYLQRLQSTCASAADALNNLSSFLQHQPEACQRFRLWHLKKYNRLFILTRVPRSEMTALKPDFWFKWQESTFRVFVNAILKLLKYCSKVKMKCKYFSRHEQTLCYVLNACIYMNNNNI